MAAELWPFDWHMVWANKYILEGYTEIDSQRASCIGDGTTSLWMTVNRPNCIRVCKWLSFLIANEFLNRGVWRIRGSFRDLLETCVRLRNHALRESLHVNKHYRLIMANKENENVIEPRWTLRSYWKICSGMTDYFFDKKSDFSSIDAEGNVMCRAVAITAIL